MKRNAMIIACVSLCLGSLAVGVGMAFSAFSSSKREILNMAVNGTHAKTLFLNPGIWEVDGAEFRLYGYHEADAQVVWIAPTYKSPLGYYVFEYDNFDYNEVVFARMNPVSATLNDFIEDTTNTWNKVEAGAIPADKNCYKVTDWKLNESSGKTSKGQWEVYADA